jgi:microcystin-dependent protein
MVKITNDSIDLSANLQQKSKMPVTGLISLWTGTSIPANTLLCDNAEYNIADYPMLASFLNYSAPATKFRVPNLNGRFPLGADNSSTITNGGVMIGGASQINSIAHSHTVTISPVLSNIQNANNPEIGNGAYNNLLKVQNVTLTTEPNTSSTKIDYLPEYTVVRYIIHI